MQWPVKWAGQQGDPSAGREPARRTDVADQAHDQRTPHKCYAVRPDTELR